MSLPLGIEVRIGTPEGGDYQGRCLGIEPVREQILASVEFEAARAPLLPLGQEIEIEFRAEGIDSGVHARALTILRADDAAHRSYCFQGRVSKRVLMHLMDRRRALRTRLSPTETVRVALLDLGDPPPEARLHDISATGFSLSIEPALERRLYSLSALRVLFRLPGAAANAEVLAHIRHRRLIGDAYVYGLEIEGRIPQFMRAQEGFLLHLASLRSRAFDAG